MIVPQSFEDGLLRTDEIEDIAAHVNGLPYTADGSLAVSLEGTVNHVSGGVPFDVNGRVCVGEGDPAWYLRGLAVTSAGRLCVAFSGDAVLHIGGLPATAAGAILANLNAAATFAIDFARDQYSTLSPALTVSSPTGGVMVPDYLGNYHKTLAGEIPIRGGRRLYNLLTSTDTLATQGVTVEDADYWLSFKGTGSVAVTGVATDSLAGTGADDRVSKKVTMGSAGTATFTVTGSVTEAYLYRSRPGQTTADPEYVSRGVLSSPYHGYGVDGLAWMRTDPNGLPLADGLGPELVTNGGPGFVNDSGWSSTTTTRQVVEGDLIATAVDGSSDRAEYAFSALTVGATYRARARVASSVASVGVSTIQSWTIGSINTINVDHTDFREYEFDFVCTSVSGVARFYADVSSGAPGKSIKIREFSLREVYPVPCTGIAGWPTLTNRLNYNQDASQWTKRGSATCTNADDGTIEGGYFELRGLGNRAIDDVYRICSGFVADEDAAPALLIRPVDTAGTLRLFNPQNANYGTWEVDLSALAVGRWNFVKLGHSAVTVVNAFSASGTAAGLHFAAVDGTGPIDVDVAVPTIIGGTLYCPVVIPTASLAVSVTKILKTPDPAAIGLTAGLGTFVIEHTPELPPTAFNNQQLLLTLYTDGNNRANLYNQSNGLGSFVNDGAVTQWLGGSLGAAWTASQLQRVAWRVEVDDGSLVTDGIERNTDTSMTVPDVSTIYLGGDTSSKYAGSIGAFAYYAEPV